MKKQQENAMFDRVVLASYSEDGRLLSVVSDYDFSSAGGVVPYHWDACIPEGEIPKMAKVCVWDEYSGMTPLSDTAVWSADSVGLPQKTIVTIPIEQYEYMDDYEFYCGDGTTYSLDWDMNIIINGFASCEVYHIYELIDYAKEPILLGDTNGDGVYDVVRVNAYATASFDSYNPTLGQIRFSESTQSYRINLPEEYTLLCDGQKISPEELKSGDTLSILYQPDEFQYSERYKILVSRKKVIGKVLSEKWDSIELDVGTYPAMSSYMPEFLPGRKYCFSVDVFGMLFTVEEYLPKENLAILEDYQIPTGGTEYVATLFCADGSVKRATIDTEQVTYFERSSDREPIDSQILEYIYPYLSIGYTDKEFVARRVVCCEISPTTGEIISLYPVSRATYTTEASYNAEQQKVGDIQMSEDTTIVDAVVYNNKMEDATIDDLNKSDILAFTSAWYYTVYAFGSPEADNSYPFVIVTNVVAPTQDLEFSILITAPVDNSVGALQNGEERYLYLSEDVVVRGSTIEELQKGDVVFFTFNKYDEISEIDVVLRAEEMGISKYSTLKANAESGAIRNAIRIPEAMENATTSWSSRTDGEEINPAKDVTRLLFGPVLEKGSNYFSIASYANGTIEDYTGTYSCMYEPASYRDGGYVEIDVTDRTDVYVYDYSLPTESRLTTGTFGFVMESYIQTSVLMDDYIPWGEINSNNSWIHYAFVRTVDGEAREIYFFAAL